MRDTSEYTPNESSTIDTVDICPILNKNYCLFIGSNKCSNEGIFLIKETCPIIKTFNLLGKKWVITIIILLSKSSGSFNSFMKRIPKISTKILSDRLDLLISEECIIRQVTNKKPLKITYELSEKGKELAKMIVYIGELQQTKQSFK